MTVSHRALGVLALAVLVALAGCSAVGGGDTATASPDAAGGAGTDAATTTGTDAAPSGTASATASATAADGGEEGEAGDTATPTAPPTETVVSKTGIRVVEIHADAEGRDAENLRDEYVVLKNTGDQPIDLTGWRVKDEDGQVHQFSDGLTLEVGETLTLHTGSGTQTAADRYWWADGPVWDNGGDTIAIYDDRGQKVYERSY